MPRAKKNGWYFYNMPLWDLMLHSVPLVLCRDFFPSFYRVAMLFWSGWMIGLLHFLLQCSAAFCQFSQARLTFFTSLSSVSCNKVVPVSGTLHLQQTFISLSLIKILKAQKNPKQISANSFILSDFLCVWGKFLLWQTVFFVGLLVLLTARVIIAQCGQDLDY